MWNPIVLNPVPYIAYGKTMLYISHCSQNMCRMCQRKYRLKCRPNHKYELIIHNHATDRIFRRLTDRDHRGLMGRCWAWIRVASCSSHICAYTMKEKLFINCDVTAATFVNATITITHRNTASEKMQLYADICSVATQKIGCVLKTKTGTCARYTPAYRVADSAGHISGEKQPKLVYWVNSKQAHSAYDELSK